MQNETKLFGIRLYPVELSEAIEIVLQKLKDKNGEYFCFINVHLFMESQKDKNLMEVLNKSTGNFPDGMGVAFALKSLGYKFKGRVRGVDFMLNMCNYAEKNNLKVFLYGNTEEILTSLKAKLEIFFPKIKIVGMISPPFRQLTKEEDELYIKQINESNADLLFVSLGAPKQEKWMYEHKGKIKPLQFGVGAAFDFITGKVKQAPIWMQKSGLEWLYRLPQQPTKTIYRMSLAPKFVLRVLYLILKNLKNKLFF
jgi:N-acetylglucosaminyldiphosphoundecaprenol N-acetyl-beta-D-mannosaminyltransferase